MPRKKRDMVHLVDAESSDLFALVKVPLENWKHLPAKVQLELQQDLQGVILGMYKKIDALVSMCKDTERLEKERELEAERIRTLAGVEKESSPVIEAIEKADETEQERVGSSSQKGERKARKTSK